MNSDAWRHAPGHSFILLWTLTKAEGLTKQTDSIENEKVVYYFEGQSIVKIVARCLYRGTKVYKEYYFKNGELFFTLRILSTVNDNGVENDRTEFRNYLVNNKVIKHLVGKEERYCRQCSFDENSIAYKLLNNASQKGFGDLACYQDE